MTGPTVEEGGRRTERGRKSDPGAEMVRAPGLNALAFASRSRLGDVFGYEA